MDSFQDRPDIASVDPDDSELYRFSVSEIALIGILLCLILFILKYAAAIIMPITLAFMLSLLFAPVVHFFSVLHIPRSIGAAIVVLSITGMITGGIIFLSEPAGKWLDKAPQHLHRIEHKVQKLKKPVQQVQKAAEKVEDMAEINKEPDQLTVKVEPKKLFEKVFVTTPKLLAFLVLLIVLLYFLLLSGAELAEHLVHLISRLARRQCRVDMGHFIQQEISRYLFTIATINICLGITVTIVLAIIGMPNPILWGTMTGVLNFAPYIGALISAVVIATVSFATFEQTSHILLAPALFLIITALEGQVITPLILGRNFSLNPLLVFLSMIVWGWMWGYVGALLAVPLLVNIKIICQSVDTLQPVARFIGGNEKIETG